MRQSTYRRAAARRRLRVAVLLLILTVLVIGSAVFLSRFSSPNTATNADIPASTASGTTTTATTVSVTTTTAPPTAAFEHLPVSAPRLLVYDVWEQRVLYGKNEHAVCAPASLTKLMTAIVALEHADPETVLTAGNELYLLDPESSRAGIYLGYRMTLRQALQGLLLKSGNDAAYVIAAQIGHRMDESLSGQAAIDLFCRKMTEKAAELGCTDTVFLNPDGIDREGHHTTAANLLKITLHALEQPLIAATVATEQVTATLLSGQTKIWSNSNLLMRPDGQYTYDGTIGIKTGTTAEAGNCLISCVTRGDRTVLCILLGAESDALRYAETILLLDAAFGTTAATA